MRRLIPAFILIFIGINGQADAQPIGKQTQTSSSCQIANIKKGASGKHCDVPIPPSCKVATHSITKTHWADIEKSPGIACRFDEKSDWKTRITGTCDTCKGRQCGAKFTVYFDCAQPKTP